MDASIPENWLEKSLIPSSRISRKYFCSLLTRTRRHVDSSMQFVSSCITIFHSRSMFAFIAKNHHFCSFSCAMLACLKRTSRPMCESLSQYRIKGASTLRPSRRMPYHLRMQIYHTVLVLILYSIINHFSYSKGNLLRALVLPIFPKCRHIFRDPINVISLECR